MIRACPYGRDAVAYADAFDFWLYLGEQRRVVAVVHLGVFTLITVLLVTERFPFGLLYTLVDLGSCQLFRSFCQLDSLKCWEMCSAGSTIPCWGL